MNDTDVSNTATNAAAGNLARLATMYDQAEGDE